MWALNPAGECSENTPGDSVNEKAEIRVICLQVMKSKRVGQKQTFP